MQYHHNWHWYQLSRKSGKRASRVHAALGALQVLSVVAKQIMTIQAALAAGERWFIFEVNTLQSTD